jgi:hypothetical protein
MFKSFNVAKLKAALTYLWIVLMILCLFIGRIDLSIFAVLMLILMELEKLNGNLKNAS